MTGAPVPQCWALRVRYRPPFDWQAMLAFLGTRAMPGVERVGGDRYARVFDIAGRTGTVEVADVPARHSLRAIVRADDRAVLPAIRIRLRRLFDLDADPAAIAAVLGGDPTLGPLVAARPGLRVPGAWEPLELAVRAVLGQQITVRAATRLAARLVDALGIRVDTAGDGLTRAFPRADAFDVAVIRSLGMPAARAAAIAGIARATREDDGLFEPDSDPGADPDAAIARLCALPGVGAWTAQYIAMRAMRMRDAFPAGDVALQRILAEGGQRPSAVALRARSEAWRPWRAYAVLHLWTSEALRDAAMAA